MKFQFVASDLLKYCPSVADTIDSASKLFIIGCYQLVEENEDESEQETNHLSKINRRYGCLVLIKETKIIYNFDCPDGGVFDLKIIRSGSLDGQRCWVAHSNGTIACYNLINNTIVLGQQIATASSMLCSIEILNSSDDLLIAGDSQSQLIVAQESKVLSNYKINNQSDDPVWCIKSVQHDQSTHLVLIGSEDSQLRFHWIKSNEFMCKCSKVIKDFTAGVTSIALIKNPESNQTFNYVLYVGSYDETIRVYYLNVNQVTETLELISIKSINIEGSGIWRLIPVNCAGGEWPYILIAGMFSGAHLILKFSQLATIKIESNQTDEKDNQRKIESSKNSSNHLVYGVASLSNCHLIVVTSFYDKSYQIYQRID